MLSSSLYLVTKGDSLAHNTETDGTKLTSKDIFVANSSLPRRHYYLPCWSISVCEAAPAQQAVAAADDDSLLLLLGLLLVVMLALFEISCRLIVFFARLSFISVCWPLLRRRQR